MSEPDYRRPFSGEDFRGFFTWDSELTKRLGGSLYHACHKGELKRSLREGILAMRSTWKVELPVHGLWEAPGIWCGLNWFHNGNRYGPFLFTIPINILNGRTFMVFRRIGERRRYFFVQYEAKIPVFEYKGDKWRELKNSSCFIDGRNNSLTHYPGAIYDLVITTPIPLDGTSVEGVSHPSCISSKCNGSNSATNMDKLQEIGIAHYTRSLLTDQKYLAFIKQFPCAVSKSIRLPDPDDITDK